MSNGSDIIIKGGSTELTFSDQIYAQDPLQPNTYANSNKKLVHVTITGDIEFDSGDEKPEGLNCKIIVSCR